MLLREMLFWLCGFLQVEVIKKAYMQGEIEVTEPEEDEDGEEEHSASPRNVGHNIYILAHQVSIILFIKLMWKTTHMNKFKCIAI